MLLKDGSTNLPSNGSVAHNSQLFMMHGDVTFSKIVLIYPTVRLPSTVWYEFPVGKIFVPARVSFRARQDCCLDEGPTVWQFVGSNSAHCGEFGEWTVLCEDKSDLGYRNKALTKYCDVDEKIMNEYAQFRCLGISVLNTRSKSSAASLRDVRMWKFIIE